MTPIDGTLDNLVVRLQEDCAVSEIIVKGVDSRLDVQTVEPESKYSRFSLAFRIEVVDLELLFLCNRI